MEGTYYVGPSINKAVYTASSVACFWAGAITLLIVSSAETVLFDQFGLFLY